MTVTPHEERHFDIQTVSSPKKMDIKFLIFISASIIVALILVVVSMYLYQRSGAAQLDLSRPTYESVRSQAQQSDKIEDFSATGDLGDEDMKKFKEIYEKTAKDVQSQANSFSPDDIDNKSLSIEIK
jgi:hypothetical protein